MKGIVAVVTGGGKTIFAELCILEFLRRVPDGRVLIVVPTLALVDQWLVSLTEDLGVGPSEIATYSGEGMPDSPALINVLVVNSARTKITKVTDESVGFLIVDECHRLGSPENARVFTSRFAATLGLSATPERDYDTAFTDVLVPNLGEIVYRYGYEQARQDGVVVPFDLVNVEVVLLEHEQETYDRLSNAIAREMKQIEHGVADKRRLEELLRRRARVSNNAVMRIPVAARLVEQHHAVRTIVFHEAIEGAEALARILSGRGITATLYHSKIDSSFRRDNLRLFRRGAFDVLVTCRALDEGLNVPETGIAVIASSTASHRQRIQRMGRVLRPARGKERVTIYTIYASEPERRRLSKEADALPGGGKVTWIKGYRREDEQTSGR